MVSQDTEGEAVRAPGQLGTLEHSRSAPPTGNLLLLSLGMGWSTPRLPQVLPTPHSAASGSLKGFLLWPLCLTLIL